MKISKKSIIAASIVRYLKKTNKATEREIADHLGISCPYFHQTVKFLVKAGIVKSERGNNGGYTLNKDNVTYKDVVMAVDGKHWEYKGDWKIVVDQLKEVLKSNEV